MQIEIIQAFLQVCKDGAISKSCDKMNISQQGLSRQLKVLERELGVGLFERSNQGIRLTQEGQLIRPYFEEIDRQYTALRQMLRWRQSSDVIRLGFSVSAAHAVGSDFIIHYQTLHPEMLVQISSVTNNDCEQQLLSGELDAALLVSPAHLERYDSVLVFESPACAVLSKKHPLAGRRMIKLEDLQGETLFIPNRQYRMRQLFDETYEKMIPKFGRIFQSAEYMDYLKLPEETEGVALGFAVFCQNLGENLTVIPLEEKLPIRIYFCTNPQSMHSERLDDFRGFVEQTLLVKNRLQGNEWDNIKKH